MGNRIQVWRDTDGADWVPDDGGTVDQMSGQPTSLKMSNGLTSVVVAVLAMATSGEASSETERRLALQIIGRDQSVLGSGTVGFAIDDLSWPDGEAEFASAKEFVLRSIRRAASGQDWDRLGYQPRRDWLVRSLERLGQLVDQLDLATVRTSTVPAIDALMPETFDAWCNRHQALEHLAGCVVCNDQ